MISAEVDRCWYGESCGLIRDGTQGEVKSLHKSQSRQLFKQGKIDMLTRDLGELITAE